MRKGGEAKAHDTKRSVTQKVCTHTSHGGGGGGGGGEGTRAKSRLQETLPFVRGEGGKEGFFHSELFSAIPPYPTMERKGGCLVVVPSSSWPSRWGKGGRGDFFVSAHPPPPLQPSRGPPKKRPSDTELQSHSSSRRSSYPSSSSCS